MRFFWIIILFSSTFVFSSVFVPSNFLNVSPEFSKYLIIAEKTKLKIHVYEVNKTQIKRLKSFQMAYGKSPGDKRAEGDKKTPEGVYFIKDFFKSDQLIQKYGDYGKIYGAGAFTLDYPNIMDKRSGKTGDGIWLHSTDDESRIAKGLDSRGCLVVKDQDLKEIAKHINIYSGTPIIVVQDLQFIDKESQILLDQKLRAAVDSWAVSWRKKDLDGYIAQYHPNYKSRGNNIKWFKNYKKRVFKRTNFINLELSNYSALQFKDYAVVTINQLYESNLVKDQGLKTLFFQKNAQNEWKIIHEKWSRKKRVREIAKKADGEFSYFN